jgi:hypothetical protein
LGNSVLNEEEIKKIKSWYPEWDFESGFTGFSGLRRTSLVRVSG